MVIVEVLLEPLLNLVVQHLLIILFRRKKVGLYLIGSYLDLLIPWCHIHTAVFSFVHCSFALRLLAVFLPALGPSIIIIIAVGQMISDQHIVRGVALN